LTDSLDHAPVAGGALVGDDDAPDGILLAAHTGEPEPYRHAFPLVKFWKLTGRA
jgi:hypothetical protein